MECCAPFMPERLVTLYIVLQTIAGSKEEHAAIKQAFSFCFNAHACSIAKEWYG